MAWTAQRVFEALSTIEQTHDLLRHEIDGWAAWTVLRFDVAHSLMNIGFSSSSRRLTRAEQLAFAARDVGAFATRRRSRYVVSTFTSALIDERNGRYQDRYFSALGLTDSFRIEALNNISFLPRRRRAATPAHMTDCAANLATGLLSRQRRPEIQAVARAISDVLRASLDADRFSRDWVDVRLRYFAAGAKVYTKLFGHLRAETLLVADQMQYAMVAGARSSGMSVVELQHGINDRHHPAYSWTSYARPYRARMPLPDRICLYGEHWKQELEKSGFWGDALRVTGNPYLDQHRGLSKDDGQVTILFTAQGFDEAPAAEWLARALSAADASVRLYIRLHPVFTGSKETFVRALGNDPRVSVMMPDETPTTIELLARAHLHVSISSATHYEAVGLGVPTVILPFRMHQSLLPLHEAGHAHLAETPDALAELFRSAKRLTVPEGAAQRYFRPDAVAHIRREIDFR
jgi:hypothetical protein